MSDTQTAPMGVNKLYFAAWRWHFYAGLYVIPFIFMLAVTGIAMVWLTAISPEYGDRLPVALQTTQLSLPDQTAAALATHPRVKSANTSRAIVPPPQHCFGWILRAVSR